MEKLFAEIIKKDEIKRYVNQLIQNLADPKRYSGPKTAQTITRETHSFENRSDGLYHVKSTEVDSGMTSLAQSVANNEYQMHIQQADMKKEKIIDGLINQVLDTAMEMKNLTRQEESKIKTLARSYVNNLEHSYTEIYTNILHTNEEIVKLNQTKTRPNKIGMYGAAGLLCAIVGIVLCIVPDIFSFLKIIGAILIVVGGGVFAYFIWCTVKGRKKENKDLPQEIDNIRNSALSQINDMIQTFKNEFGSYDMLLPELEDNGWIDKSIEQPKLLKW